MFSATETPKKNIGAILLLAGLCVLAYLPAFNNGFISDDYVILDRLDSVRHDVFYLFSVPPECYRFTSYVCFGILRFLFGYQAPWYYGFNLLLHFINSILLWKLLTRITGSHTTGYLAAVLFAVIQGHQEAIMWLAAMNETLLGCCLLACLILWIRGQIVWSSLLYVTGLFSKESAMMLLGLVPWVEWHMSWPGRFRRAYISILAISVAFIALFGYFATRNFMIATGTYALGLHALTVFLASMHRLMFPWVYLAVMIHLIRRGGRRPIQTAGWGVGFAAIALLPYIFLTYQNHVTSRQEYLASMGIVWALATLIHALDHRALRRGFLLVFIMANIGYIWIKDKQFEQRAAPTNRLIEQLQAHAPQNLAILDFPANPWIARNIFRMVPGWQPEMIHVGPAASECVRCLTLQWDPAQERYREIR